ncbi:MAG: hypothetical protein IT184_07415 [Acidobacteria bacterium]|nr:hypothetical protein [Acidobacteriota bacterium]
MRRRWLLGILAMLWASGGAAAQSPLSPTAFHRVFLTTGEALPTYGGAATVGDRLIFTLAIVHADGTFALQLMSLPVSRVDLGRTTRYARALRERAYAVTRGDAEYAAFVADVGQELSAMAALDDRALQVARALIVRQRLLAWPRDHFNYRASDVAQLVARLDAVLREQPSSDGPASIAFELTSDAGMAVLPPPAASDSIDAAAVAADAADIGEERVAILRAALAAASDESVRRRLALRLERELEAELRYAALVGDLRARAAAARRSGDAGAVETLRDELPARDAALGHRRPQIVERLAVELGLAADAARARRAALDRYRATIGALVEYERRIRPAFSGLSGLETLLARLRDVERVPYERTLAAERRVQRWRDLVDAVAPPADLAGVHATLASALRMAQEACVRRRLADVTARDAPAREAASAAAGALLLGDRARGDLVAALLPPRD